MQRLRQACQVLWKHANDTCTWAINLGYEKERDRYIKRQYRKQQARLPMRLVSNYQVAADSESYHQSPSPKPNAIPPSSLRISLPVQDIVHPQNSEGDRRSWL